MFDNIVCQRYAKALMESVDSVVNFDEIISQLSETHTLIDNNPTVKHIIENRGIRVEEKIEVFKQVFSKMPLNPIVRNFLLLLVEKERIMLLKGIMETFIKLVNDRLYKVDAYIQTPFPLTDDQKNQISTQFKRILNKKDIEIHETIVEEMIGGVIIRIGNEVYDGSIKTQLYKLKEHLLREG